MKDKIIEVVQNFIKYIFKIMEFISDNAVSIALILIVFLFSIKIGQYEINHPIVDFTQTISTHLMFFLIGRLFFKYSEKLHVRYGNINTRALIHVLLVSIIGKYIIETLDSFGIRSTEDFYILTIVLIITVVISNSLISILENGCIRVIDICSRKE